MNSASHFSSKNVCHGNSSKVTEVDKFHNFGVDYALAIIIKSIKNKRFCPNLCMPNRYTFGICIIRNENQEIFKSLDFSFRFWEIKIYPEMKGKIFNYVWKCMIFVHVNIS